MKFRNVSLAVVAGLACALVFAQDQSKPGKLLHKPKKVEQKVDNSPVTQAEARATFEHVMKGLPALTNGKIDVGTSTIPATPKSVTRQEVIMEMNRLYEAAKPYFKFTPRAVWYDPKAFTVKAGTPTRAALEKMVKRGFIAIASPMATAPSDYLSVSDFGDTVGIFVARLSDLTHMPDTKYSPAITGEGPNYNGPIKH